MIIRRFTDKNRQPISGLSPRPLTVPIIPAGYQHALFFPLARTFHVVSISFTNVSGRFIPDNPVLRLPGAS